MKVTHKASNFGVAMMALLLCAGAVHSAESYPSKPGRLILPFAAGASTDIVGRIFAQRFGEAWGQTLVVDNRAEQLPDVPTVMESGVPDFEVTVWQGYAVPKGTPQPFVSKIHAAMMKALAVPELKQRFFENGVAAAPMTPVEFTKFVNVETAKWQKAVTLSGAKVE